MMSLAALPLLAFVALAGAAVPIATHALPVSAASAKPAASLAANEAPLQGDCARTARI